MPITISLVKGINVRQTAACESMELTPPADLKTLAVEIIASLITQELGKPRKAFAENKHPRFMKEFSFHDPYGKSKFFRNSIGNAMWRNSLN